MEGLQMLGAVLRNPGASSGASTFFVLQDVGSKPAFVSHVGGVFPVFLLDHILQVVVHLRSDAHGLPEVFGPDGEDHELLHGQLVASVRAPVDDVESLWGERQVQLQARGGRAPQQPPDAQVHGSHVGPVRL